MQLADIRAITTADIPALLPLVEQYWIFEDIAHFDHLLANGSPAVHAALGARPDLEPVTTRGRFRLYRVRAGSRP